MADFFVETQAQCPVALVQEVEQVQRTSSAVALGTLFSERGGFLPSPLCSRAMVAHLSEKISETDSTDYTSLMLIQMLGVFGALQETAEGRAYLDDAYMHTVRSAIERMSYAHGDGRFAHLYFAAAHSYAAHVDPTIIENWTFRPENARFDETWAYAVYKLHRHDKDMRDKVAEKLATIPDPNHLLLMLQNVATTGEFSRPLLEAFQDDPRRPDNGIEGWDLDTIGQEVSRILQLQ